MSDMTYEQMWRRYKTLQKDGSWECRCPVCNKGIAYEDDDIEYAKARSGTDIFIHRECVKNW